MCSEQGYVEIIAERKTAKKTIAHLRADLTNANTTIAELRESAVDADNVIETLKGLVSRAGRKLTECLRDRNGQRAHGFILRGEKGGG